MSARVPDFVCAYKAIKNRVFVYPSYTNYALLSPGVECLGPERLLPVRMPVLGTATVWYLADLGSRDDVEGALWGADVVLWRLDSGKSLALRADAADPLRLRL